MGNTRQGWEATSALHSALDMETEHIQACLDTQHRMCPQYRTAFLNELVYRKDTNLSPKEPVTEATTVADDVIERLRNAASETECPNMSLEAVASDLIEQQQKRIERLELERNNAIDTNSSRENEIIALEQRIGELENLKTGWEFIAAANEELRGQLAAAQAENVKLREVLKSYDGSHRLDQWDENIMPSREWAAKRKEVLAFPTDTSALRERLKQERERCAKVCEEIDVAAFGGDRPAPNDCADSIRAMEDK